jgi:hypothetical protein
MRYYLGLGVGHTHQSGGRHGSGVPANSQEPDPGTVAHDDDIDDAQSLGDGMPTDGDNSSGEDTSESGEDLSEEDGDSEEDYSDDAEVLVMEEMYGHGPELY